MKISYFEWVTFQNYEVNYDKFFEILKRNPKKLGHLINFVVIA